MQRQFFSSDREQHHENEFSNNEENFQSDRVDSSASTSLDENLWGTLQHHIDLAENIYSKLPLEEFFQLRTVCKDWYVIACKHLGLKEPLHKPFFSLFTKGEDGQADGILIYNALSRSWNWRVGCTYSHSFDFVANKGVVFRRGDRFGIPVCEYHPATAFHWQSKIYQRLRPPPTLRSIHEKMILGMSVSEKQGHVSSFRVVCGSQNFGTEVYESGMWQTKPCRAPKPERGGPLQATTGCADCNERVYITTEHSREIFVYDFEKARWSSLLSPSDWGSNLPQHYYLNTLGVWNGRVFNVTCDFQSEPRNENWSLQVWELVDETLHKWKVYDCMPKGLCSWLRSTKGFLDGLYTKAGDISMQASFCGDFMLVYSWDFKTGWGGRFCLFNMATRNWQKLNIAAGTVAIGDECPSDDSLDLHAYPYESSLDEFMMEDDDSDSDFGSGWDVFPF